MSISMLKYVRKKVFLVLNKEKCHQEKIKKEKNNINALALLSYLDEYIYIIYIYICIYYKYLYYLNLHLYNINFYLI